MVFIGTLETYFREWFEQHSTSFSSVFILTDEHVKTHCLPLFFEKSGLPPETPVVVIPPGEANKTIQTANYVWEKMLEARLDRKALLINLGGGVVSDLGGFCAALWKRGIRYVNVPTTLLAMNDAAIGGKTGVDLNQVKNVIGTFHNPLAVFVESQFLETLSYLEKRSGYAEMIKHAMITTNTTLIMAMDRVAGNLVKFTEEHLHLSISVKEAIVAEDPLETKGLRQILNYGHTFGHAIETYLMETGRAVTHGEAVAVGMLCEGYLAHSSGRMRYHRFIRLHVVVTLNRLYEQLPLKMEDADRLWELMLQDKKNENGQVIIAYPDMDFFYDEDDENPPIYRPLVLQSITREEMEEALEFYTRSYNLATIPEGLDIIITARPPIYYYSTNEDEEEALPEESYPDEQDE